MLTNLRLQNFIIVEDLEIDLSEGLQVLTGETGAGKSIIVGAIDVIFGADIHPGMQYDETKKTVLEATFNLEECKGSIERLLEKYEVEPVDNEIFLTKEIGSNLRSRVFLNGRRISIPIAREFRSSLIDFHSQRDQQRLFDRDYQLQILDRYGNLIPQRTEFEKQYEGFFSKKQKLLNLQKQEKEKRDKLELYRYQLQELQALSLKKNEDKQLQQELDLLSNAEDILEMAGDIEQKIFENENSVHDIINGFIKRLEPLASGNEHLASAVALMHESLTNLDEAVQELRVLQDEIDLDEERKQQLETRYDKINTIITKYKMSIPEILQYHHKIEQELATYSSQTEKIKSLEKELIIQQQQLLTNAQKLSDERIKAAKKLEKDITSNIKKLAIPDARVKIRFDKVSGEKDLISNEIAPKKSGFDSVDFYFSANRGVKLQPFRIIASGGEVSRFLLTVKKILSDKMEKKTIIFDEIDQGIGGKTSQLLAEFIRNIGRYHQVICISHLPQIAAFAENHYAIRKISEEKSAKVLIEKLNNKKRREEIARMLAGSNTKLALEHADELISKKRSRL